MEKKQVLIINQFASTPKYSSGAGERFYYLLPFFEEAGFDCTVLSASYNHLFTALPDVEDRFTKEEVPGGRFVWVRLRKYDEKKFVQRIISWVQFVVQLFFYKPKGKVDVVILSSMSIFPIINAVRLRRKYGAKIVLEVRDIWPLTPMDLGGYSGKHPFIWFMSKVEKFAYSRADRLVSVLPGFHRHASEVLDEDVESIWLPNGIHRPNSIPEVKTKQSATFKVMYTGALGIANAMNYVIQAAALLKDEKDVLFEIIGEGPEKQELKEWANENGLQNVRFYDKIQKDEVLEQLQKADIGIISWMNRRVYSFGVSANKYNDYMLAGLPIVSASNIEDDPVVKARCGIQAIPENAKSIADAILALKNMSSEERRIIGKNGQNYVLENQIYSEIAQKYTELLHRL